MMPLLGHLRLRRCLPSIMMLRGVGFYTWSFAILQPTLHRPSQDDDIWAWTHWPGSSCATLAVVPIGSLLSYLHRQHYCFKFILDQRLFSSTSRPTRCFDFMIEYRPSRLNLAVGDLLCRDIDNTKNSVGLHSLSRPSFHLLNKIKATTTNDEVDGRLYK